MFCNGVYYNMMWVGICTGGNPLQFIKGEEGVGELAIDVGRAVLVPTHYSAISSCIFSFLVFKKYNCILYDFTFFP